MHITIDQLVGTAIATGVAGFVVWFVTVPLRKRSVSGLIASVVVTGPVAVLGGIGWALLLGPDVSGPEAALELALVAVVVAAVEGGIGAARAHRRFARSHRALRASVGGLADDLTADCGAGRPLLAELEAVRGDLTRLARGLHAERARDHALDESRRRLIAWVSQDLHAPLTVLRAMSEPADDDHPGAATDVRAELDRLVAVVDDLFDLATAAPDHAARSLVLPRGAPVLLADVLGDAVTALEPLLRLRGVGVNVRGDTTVQVRMLTTNGDDLSRRLVTTLVDAVRQSRTGSTMTVEVSLLADDDDVRLDVTPGGSEPTPGRPASVTGRDVRLPVAV